MKKFRLCFVGYLLYLSLTLITYIIDALMGLGGSGDIFERFWLLVLILSSIIIFVGTIRFIFISLPWKNRIMLIILSLVITFLQIVILMAILFFLVTLIVDPIMINFGYQVTSM